MLRLISRSMTPAISIEEMADHLRRSDTEEEDEYIRTCALAATQAVEDFTGLALVEQTWDYYTDAFPWSATMPLYIPKPPLLEVITLAYRDTGGAAASFSNFTVEGGSGDRPSPARLYVPFGVSWPDVDGQPNCIRVRFRAGYLDEGASPLINTEGIIPELVKAAIKLYAASLYEQREGKAPDKGILEMLRGYRMESSIG